MHPARTAEPEIQELGGEPLAGSGFETEDPTPGFESGERSAQEGINQ